VVLGQNSQTIQAAAVLSLSVPLFNQDASTPLFLPVGDGDFTFTGLLQTGSMTFASCPCSAEFILEGGAVASGEDGTSASFSDPISFALPPGWTYTPAQHRAYPRRPKSRCGCAQRLGQDLKHVSAGRGCQSSTSPGLTSIESSLFY
jgi:hypothetical protein